MSQGPLRITTSEEGHKVYTKTSGRSWRSMERLKKSILFSLELRGNVSYLYTIRNIVLTTHAAADGSRFVPETVKDDIIFKGGCRCGGVQYTSSARPKDITCCHCRACQQVSGSAYIPFTGVPKRALTFTESSSREFLKLSDVAERSFCSKCGSPITMTYSFDENEVSLTMSSVDLGSLKCESPTVKKHIFLREKASWLTLAEDGAERWGTSEDAHLIQSK